MRRGKNDEQLLVKRSKLTLRAERGVGVMVLVECFPRVGQGTEKKVTDVRMLLNCSFVVFVEISRCS